MKSRTLSVFLLIAPVAGTLAAWPQVAASASIATLAQGVPEAQAFVKDIQGRMIRMRRFAGRKQAT